MKAHTPDLIKDTCRESFSKQFEELESPGKHLRDQIVAMVTLPQNIKVQKKLSSLQTSLHDFFAQAPNKASNVGALGPDMRPTKSRTTRANTTHISAQDKIAKPLNKRDQKAQTKAKRKYEKSEALVAQVDEEPPKKSARKTKASAKKEKDVEMNGKRSARTPVKRKEPAARKNAGMESPRAPEEVKKRHKGAHQEAASKSPAKSSTAAM